MSATVAAALVALGLVALLLIQGVGLRSQTKSSLIAVRAAVWFADHRLTDGVVTIAGLHPVSSSCASGWFTRADRRRARGSLATVGSRFAVLVVPPHTIETTGNRRFVRGLSPLLALELAACPRLFSRELIAAAEVPGATRLNETRTSLGRLWALRFPIKATRVTLYLQPGSIRPIALTVASRRLHARTRIQFGLLSTSLLHEFSRQLWRSAPRFDRDHPARIVRARAPAPDASVPAALNGYGGR